MSNHRCENNNECYYNLYVSIIMAKEICGRTISTKEGPNIFGIAFNLERLLRESKVYIYDDKKDINTEDEKIKNIILNRCKDCPNRELEQYTGVSYKNVVETFIEGGTRIA